MQKVFGVGLSRTGTTSLQFALKHLGYRHRGSCGRMLRKVVVEQEWSSLFVEAEKYDSFEDVPWCLFYKELDEQFPGSKFILTVRSDADAWLSSCIRHCRNRERNGRSSESWELVYGYCSPVGRENEHRKLYESHNKAVRDYFAGRPGQLLEVCWEDGSGWCEVCEFLGHTVPSVPFPHKHRSETPAKRVVRKVKARVRSLLRAS